MSSSSTFGDVEFSSQRFGSFSPSYEEEDVDSSSVKEASADHPSPYSTADADVFSPERDGNGPILPPPDVLQPEEGFALREWRRQNAIRLEEKEKREKELLKEIIEEADEYKAEFYKKWKVRIENNKATNKEKEKLFLESREKFHAEASKNYWKGIAEMIPKEIPKIEKKGKKKDEEKKPSIVVLQGPKPGKPTDLSRMRQVLVKLKHKPPPHMNSPSPTLSSSLPGKDAKAGASSSAASAPSPVKPSDI